MSIYEDNYESDQLDDLIKEQLQSSIKQEDSSGSDKNNSTYEEEDMSKIADDFVSSSEGGFIEDRNANDDERVSDDIDNDQTDNTDDSDQIDDQTDDNANDESNDETTESDTDNTSDQSTDQSGQGDTTNEEPNLFDLIVEEALLDIPDDFDTENMTEQDLEYLKEYTNSNRQIEVINQMRSRFQDPYAKEVLNYFLAGDTSADLPRYMNILDTLKDFTQYDITIEANKRNILDQYYREGLDPNIPTHQARLNMVPSQIDEIMKDEAGSDTQAQEAKDYFINKNNQLRVQELQRAQQENLQNQELERQRQEDVRKWHENFQNVIQTNTWNARKKQAILEEQYGQVQTTNGETVPIWVAKETMIKSDPVLYQTYLDWLNTNFDLKTGKFINDVHLDDKTKVTRRILDLARKKGRNQTRSKNNNSGKNRNTSNKNKRDVVSIGELINN